MMTVYMATRIIFPKRACQRAYQRAYEHWVRSFVKKEALRERMCVCERDKDSKVKRLQLVTDEICLKKIMTDGRSRAVMCIFGQL